MDIHFENRFIYILTASGLAGLVFAALGPGLLSSGAQAGLEWQYFVFKDLCHQQTARSFSVNGIQMAVCSRCIGIYGALLAGWLALPVFSRVLETSDKWLRRILYAGLLLNAADVAGNYFSIWTNSNGSRLLLGIILGAGISLLFKNEFFRTLTTEVNYG